MFIVAQFLEDVRTGLSKPLPGEPAQNRLSPARNYSTREFLRLNPNHRKSAVMLLLWLEGNKICSLLIRRPEYEGVHSGQMALPGGRFEAGDESLRITAMRETREEIGFEVPESLVAGALSPLYIPVSNFLVQPYVALLESRPLLNPDPKEVSEAVMFNILSLLEPGSIKTMERINANGLKVKTPYFEIEGFNVWGATAMILGEFTALAQGIISS